MTRLFGNPQGAHAGEELLSAYLDNQVTADERTRVEMHLQACASCRSELESLRQTIVLLQALHRVPVPRAFTLSEAQVGIRRQETRPWWSGAWVRGLGAVTAVALVALVATSLIRQPASAPATTVARALPTQTAAQAEVALAPQSAPQPQVAEQAATDLQPQVAEQPQPAMKQAPAADQPQITAEEAMQAEPAEARSAAPEEAPAEPATSDVAETPVEAMALAAPVAEKQAEPLADGTAEAPAVSTLAIAPEGPALSRQVGGQFGLGGGPGVGGGAAAAAFAAAPMMTPSDAPALVAAGDVLPEQAGVAYADWQSLTVLDAVSGRRELARTDGAYDPRISDDRAWVAYRAQPAGGAEIGLASWDGATRASLLNERDLAAEPFEPGYDARSIQSMDWIPGQSKLAVVTAAFPAQADLPPVQELWQVAVPAGDRERILQMGQMGRAFYAPDGARLAVLEYGTVDAPKGSLALYDADGGGAQTILTFPAAPGTPAFPTQLQWLPDGSGLLLAVPETPTGDAEAGTMVLYRVNSAGIAEQLGRVEAQETFWSPDGSALAAIRPVAAGGQELVLSGPDGSDPQVVQALQNGQFLSWSPDGRRFLYLDDYEVYAGSPDRKPQTVGNYVSAYSPRWAAPNQIVSLLDQGTAWMLVWRNLDTGEAASLASLPKDLSWDFVNP